MRFSDPKPLTAAQQFLLLTKNPLSVGDGELGSGHFNWYYKSSPTPLSRIYDARLEFEVNRSPRVFLDNPDLLMLSGGKDLPHVYDQKPTRLCLYLPRTYEWQPWMSLDQTIIPWTSLWLFYFEDWLIDGEWRGGGEHPEHRDVEQRVSRSRLQRHAPVRKAG
ncbi:hypothetical protein FS827_24515 [Agrobacterium vitis]|uniref:hypothetical protein n=1 Tax=Allorhizobium ampelinum TaxID=3025782 RepID=UPI001F22625F|nr:hypothetical protein [Allorhizobium ampelinum]MCF1464455.1 hypothetical protein [Allorhizobium ampelinum]